MPNAVSESEEVLLARLLEIKKEHEAGWLSPRQYRIAANVVEGKIQEIKKLHRLYRMFDQNGDLIYVGITCNPPARIKQHSKEKEWFSEVTHITLEPFRTRHELEEAEKHAIRTERPKYNVMHNQQLMQTIPKESGTECKGDPFSELNRRLTILENELRLLAGKKSPDLPKILSKDQFLSVTGLSNGKFRILRVHGLFPEGSYQQGGQKRWFFQRESVISFAESELCQKMLRNSDKDCETIVQNAASLKDLKID